MLGHAQVECTLFGKDGFGRYLGVCVAAGVEINSAMVQRGWALAFTKYSERYSSDQHMAENARVGLWAGTFEKPWEWRLGQTQAIQTQNKGGCVIKGNIDGRGQRIYHLPFQHFYPRTKVDEERGEKWFCTEGDALQAGWRRALR